MYSLPLDEHTTIIPS